VNTPHAELKLGYCITAYRETNYEILRAIKSALKFTKSENIILLIDKHESLCRKKLNKLCHSLKIKTYFFNENVGISKSRNYGVKYFKEQDYKYIAFLDADDYYIKDIKQTLEIFKQDKLCNIVTGGIKERSVFYEMERKGDIEEVSSMGNPVYLSAAVFRINNELKFREDIKIREDRELVHRIGRPHIRILPKIFTVKNNLPGRTNFDLVNSVTGNQVNMNRKIFAIYWKLKSIKSIKLYPLRFLFSLFFKLITLSRQPQKRIFLSINFKSMEFLNIKKVSKKNTLGVFKQFVLTKYGRDPYILDKYSIKDYFISFFSTQLILYKFVYIGLPGARIISEIIDNIQTDTKTIQLAHGRISSDKYLKFTDAVVAKVEDNYNTNRLFFYSDRPIEIIYNENKIIWIHGFKKGKGNLFIGFRGYFFTNLIHDIKYLFSLENQNKNIEVTVHPAARKFFYFLKIYTFFKKNINIIDLDKYKSLSCHSIYLSSPTVIEKVNKKQIKIDEKVRIYNLRTDIYKNLGK
tara:strand:- start:2707 stop:4269 length:1563 start_codon:yes stop_codon:yes gene_type:complete